LRFGYCINAVTMIYRFVFVSCVCLLLGGNLFSQTGLSKEVLTLINQARSNPQQFLVTHNTAIKRYQPKYIAILKAASPLPPIIWDSGLAAMAQARIEDDNLNPNYQGENKLCGFSSGWQSSSHSSQAIEYVCDVYTNINDPDYQFLGVYFNAEKNNSFSYYWGITCERENVEYTFGQTIDSSMVDFGALNTAEDVDYLKPCEKQMIQELNFVRQYPKVYAKIIAHHLAQESESVWGLDYDTHLAGLELIEELERMSPRQILQPSKCVYLAARAHGLDCQRRGYFAHTGSDGSNPWDRVQEACPDLQTGNENGAGGSADPRETVISLLLDDGISSRGHRYNILDPKWEYVGCFRYDDPKYKYHWVQKFGY
jgi:hypothetical protein